MINSYHMIIVNIIAFILIFIAFGIFKLLYPKKKINFLLLLVSLSCLPVISIFRQGTYESGDLSHHTTAILSMYDSFKEGNLIPRWGADMYYGYGGPYHIVMYFFPRYIAVLFHAFGIPILLCVKLVLAFSFVTSGVTMFYFVKSKLGEQAGLVSAIFYVFAPYHLVDLHFRVEPGELAVFALIPLLLLTIDRLFEKKNYLWTIALAVVFGLTILSHQALALIFCPFIVLYAILRKWSDKGFWKGFVLFCVGSLIASLLTSFYWITILAEGSRYTWVHNIFSGLSRIPFLNFQELLFSPWRSGFLFQGPEGQLSFILGYAHWIVLGFFLTFLFLKKDKLSKLGIFSIIGFFTVLFLMLPISHIVWETVPLLKYSQNTYRLLVFLVFFVSVLAGVISINSKKWFIVSLCIFAILSTILTWGNRRNIPTISQDIYFQNAISTFQSDFNGYGYELPIWVDPNKTPHNKKPLAPIEILKGNATIRELRRTGTYHEYLIHSKGKTLIRENTFYFPGWKVLLNGKEIEIEYKNKSIPGVITFNVPDGVHRVEVLFKNTPIRNVADGISLVTSIVCFLLVVIGISKRDA